MSKEVSPAKVRSILLAQAKDVQARMKRPVPEYAINLSKLWETIENGDSVVDGRPEVIAALRAVIEENRAKFRTIAKPLLMARIADALPTPAVVFSPAGRTWNLAMTAAMTAVMTGRNANPIEFDNDLLPLERILHAKDPLGIQNLLYPLGTAVFSLRIVHLPEGEVSVAYFFDQKIEMAPLPSPIPFLLCARLSGLATKQLAPLAGISPNRANLLFKKHQKDFHVLKRQLTF